MPAFPSEIQPLVDRLVRLRAAGGLQVAMLYGSYAKGTAHARSDIDLALALTPADAAAELSIVDELLMSVDREVSILRLDDPMNRPGSFRPRSKECIWLSQIGQLIMPPPIVLCTKVKACACTGR